MLEFLHIENIAVVECSDINFSGGFNVMTGETGAGKSIIIDSINAVLGARTSKDIIRSGAKTAKVSAEFSDIGAEAEQALNGSGFSLAEDGKLIITRIMNDDGKTSFRVNGLPANAAVIREFSKYLINIHGQHDNQSLLDPAKHCSYIDKIANNEEIKDEYLNEFKKTVAISKELQSLQMDEDEKLRKIDLLNYQISELEAADIKEGEHAELKEKLRLAQNSQKNIKNLNYCISLFNGEESAGICENLQDVIKMINAVGFDKLENVSEKINEAYETLKDASADLQYILDKDFNAELDVNALQDRLDTVNAIMLKYGGSEKSAVEFLQKARKELNDIQFSDKRICELENELEESEQRLVLKAENLTKSRETAAKIFERDVTQSLKYLDMPQVVFKVDFKSGKYTKTGCDIVEFLISANAGEDVKPLAKIASGGELSRVMLGIKSILADKDEVKTLIFDEIDAGISGRAALKVADKLKQVAKNRQVICVTHLAQIAAAASDHLLINKSTVQNKTFTTVDSLNIEQRIAELARIMSGTDMTKVMYDSAKELLDRSMKNENL